MGYLCFVDNLKEVFCGLPVLLLTGSKYYIDVRIEFRDVGKFARGYKLSIKPRIEVQTFLLQCALPFLRSTSVYFPIFDALKNQAF